MYTNILKIFMLFAMLTPAFLSAQNTSEEIVMMKLDKNYLSEESTNASEVKARDNADLLLISRITEYYKEHFPDKTLSPDVLQNIQHMSMKRGDHTRVLSYISIAVLSGEAPATPQTATAQTTTEKPAIKSEPEAKPTEQATPKTVAEAKPVTPAKPATETKPATEANTAVAENVAPPPAQDPNMTLQQWQMDVINELIYAKDINEVNSLLNLFKSLGKVSKYGIVTNCPDRNATFWVIGNNGAGIKALLGPGSTSRRNYSTGSNSALEDFKGSPALWFEFSN
ncbi:MAG: hypothetical protein NC127_04115 [Muribaculum sp.]|nr:hypothetical protein [Muribaculum sp.]